MYQLGATRSVCSVPGHGACRGMVCQGKDSRRSRVDPSASHRSASLRMTRDLAWRWVPAQPEPSTPLRRATLLPFPARGMRKKEKGGTGPSPSTPRAGGSGMSIPPTRGVSGDGLPGQGLSEVEGGSFDFAPECFAQDDTGSGVAVVPGHPEPSTPLRRAALLRFLARGIRRKEKGNAWADLIPQQLAVEGC